MSSTIKTPKVPNVSASCIYVHDTNNYVYILLFSSNVRDRSGGTGLGSIKGKHTKRNTKSSSLLIPQSPIKKNGSFFETTEPVGPTIVPVKEQPSTYTSDDITAQDNRSAMFM